MDEVHRWITRKHIKLRDPKEANKYRAIVKLGVQAIDKNNNGTVDVEEFKDLMMFVDLWKKIYINYMEIDKDKNLTLDKQKFTE